MRWWLMLIVALVITMAAHTVWAQPISFESSPFIYRLKISGCGDHEPENRRQTGFRVNGMVGIVTALHGVADCTQIHALSDDGTIFTNLEIQAVDIDHDIALLSSAELQVLPPEGLPVAETNDVQTRELRVIGYPLGLDEQDILVDVTINYTPTLQSLIPDTDLSDTFVERNSPNLAVKVFRVQGQLVPGHSGAPLLDSEGRVVAIVNGGLRGGTVEIGWAMPWYTVKQQLISLTEAEQVFLERFNKLKAQNPQLALAFSSTYPREVEVSVESTTLIGTVTGVNGKPVSGAEVTLTLIDAYYIAITDDNGIYRFSLMPDATDKFREILVESEEYQTRRFTVFEQLPPIINLDLIRIARSVALERDDYVRVIWPTGIPLHQSARDDSPIRITLSESRLLQIVGGPEQQQARRWWNVCTINQISECGWLEASSSNDIYVERLPRVYINDRLRVISEERLNLRDMYGISTNVQEGLAKGTIVTVVAEAEEADGYLWYQIEKEDGVTGWVAFAGIAGIYFEIMPEETLTVTPIPTLVTPTATSQLVATATPRIALATPTPRPTSIMADGMIEIKAEGINASSRHDERYNPDYARDGDLKTAWLSGVSDTVDSWVEVVFRTPQTISRIGLYRRENPEYAQVKAATLIFADGTQQEITFKGLAGWDYVDIDPVTTDIIKFEVTEVTPSASYLEIVELAFFGMETEEQAVTVEDTLAEIKADGISASSRYDDRYNPDYARDGDLKTAWLSGVSDTVDSWVEVAFRTPQTISRIGLYRRENPEYAEVKASTLIFADGTQQEITFKGLSSWDYVDIDPVTIDNIKLEITEISPQASYVEIVDLSFFGPQPSTANPLNPTATPTHQLAESVPSALVPTYPCEAEVMSRTGSTSVPVYDLPQRGAPIPNISLAVGTNVTITDKGTERYYIAWIVNGGRFLAWVPNENLYFQKPCAN